MLPPDVAGELNQVATRLEEIAEEVSGDDAERLQEIADDLRRLAEG